MSSRQKGKLGLSLHAGVNPHEKKEMPLLWGVIHAASANVSSTEGLFKGSLPGMAGEREVEAVDHQESAVCGQPQGETESVEAESSQLLEEVEGEASRICCPQPQGSGEEKRQKPGVDCKTNCVECGFP